MNWLKLSLEEEKKPESITTNELKKMIIDYNKRDFYFIDNRVNFDISSLTIKKECIIGKFDFIKAVIFPKYIYLIFDTFDLREFTLFKNESQSPYHLIILEFIFNQILELFDQEFTKCYNLYLEFSDKYEINSLFMKLQTTLINLEYRVKEFKNIPGNLLKNKEDLHLLTYNLISDEELEQIIENYDLKLDDIYNDILKLLREIDNIHKIVNIKLAKDRNKYALLNLYISFFSISFCFGSWLASLFGMNINNYIEDEPYSFPCIAGISLLLMTIIILFQFYYLKKI